jgi:hypothetical protein
MVGNDFLVYPDFSETMIANILAEASEIEGKLLE